MLPNPLEVIWFILPAYVANSMAINVSGFPILKKYSAPIDFGLKIRGKRILGDGKTWRGLVCGIACAVICATLQQTFQITGYPIMTPLLGFLLGLGALTGDMVESFVKRMSGFDRGHPLFLMDQLDYIIGACFFAWTVVPVDLGYLLVASMITLPLHYIASIVAWVLKLKKNPW
jgi:CDP-2,3-bis-(O-geranylgeranyl)-sn-glycerol synthase